MAVEAGTTRVPGHPGQLRVTGDQLPTSNGQRGERALLRHTLATLAYRAEKVLRDVPSGFPEQRLAARARTPLQIVGHLADLMEWAVRMAQSEMKWKPSSLGDWNG